ncbi:DUF3016 domain-containing protein [Shewanella sp.]|nr:DUF3016 domain-containing protein [Shewanella sp.]
MNVRKIMVVGLVISSLTLSGLASAADKTVENPITENGVVKVEWQNPAHFRDIKASNGLQSRFEASTFKDLTKNLNKEASKILKPGEKLELVVTDLDLAGDVQPAFGDMTNDIRVVKDLYPPRITFSYKLLKGDKVISSGQEKLTNLNFLNSMDMYNTKPHRYENALLKSWLKTTVAPKV